MPYTNGFRDRNGRIVRLSKKATFEVNYAWDQFKEYVFNPYISGRNTRTACDEHNARGKRLVDIQAEHNVWLIHPVNAKAGLTSDDPRIID